MVHTSRRQGRYVRQRSATPGETLTDDNTRVEKHLVILRKQQREKIEEIKKKTNYYSTRTLLERYDDATPGVDMQLRKRVPNAPSTPPRPPHLLQQQQQPSVAIPQTPMNAKGQIPPGLQQQLSRKYITAGRLCVF